MTSSYSRPKTVKLARRRAINRKASQRYRRRQAALKALLETLAFEATDDLEPWRFLSAAQKKET